LPDTKKLLPVIHKGSHFLLDFYPINDIYKGSHLKEAEAKRHTENGLTHKTRKPLAESGKSIVCPHMKENK